MLGRRAPPTMDKTNAYEGSDVCAVCSTARCEQFLEVSSRLGDVPQLHQVCQTWLG
jgi:hypothetical protein